MTVPISVDVEALRSAIREEYAGARSSRSRGSTSISADPRARLLGYAAEATDALPDSVIESFAGVGNPFVFG